MAIKRSPLIPLVLHGVGWNIGEYESCSQFHSRWSSNFRGEKSDFNVFPPEFSVQLIASVIYERACSSAGPPLLSRPCHGLSFSWRPVWRSLGKQSRELRGIANTDGLGLAQRSGTAQRERISDGVSRCTVLIRRPGSQTSKSTNQKEASRGFVAWIKRQRSGWSQSRTDEFNIQ